MTRRGTFQRKDGSRHQRFFCHTCWRSFSPTTGTAVAYMKKRATWAEHERAMESTSSLRAMAKRLGVHLTTAFRWRHLHLEGLRQAQRPGAPLGNTVGIGEVLIRYSEKGSRTTVGPGSHGSQWGRVFRGRGDWLGNGPKSRSAVRPGAPVFRWMVDGRPTRVLVAHDGREYRMAILGNQRLNPQLLRCGLETLVAPETEVVSQLDGPYAAACEELNLPFCKGPSTDADEDTRHRRLAAHRAAWVICRGLYAWLDQFNGVATRYLARYLAWYRAIFDRRQPAAPALSFD